MPVPNCATWSVKINFIAPRLDHRASGMRSNCYRVRFPVNILRKLTHARIWAMLDVQDGEINKTWTPLCRGLYAGRWDRPGGGKAVSRSFIHSQHSFTHSFIHSLSHPFIHSLTHSFTHSLIHSFTHSFIHSFTHSFIQSLTHSFSHWNTVSYQSSNEAASTVTFFEKKKTKDYVSLLKTPLLKNCT